MKLMTHFRSHRLWQDIFAVKSLCGKLVPREQTVCTCVSCREARGSTVDCPLCLYRVQLKVLEKT